MNRWLRGLAGGGLLVAGFVIGGMGGSSGRKAEAPLKTRATVRVSPEEHEKEERRKRQELVNTVAPRYREIAFFLREIEPRLQGVVADAMQLDDDARRAAALEKIRGMMRSADPLTARAGLTAFMRLRDLDFDKASFLTEIESCLGSDDPEVLGSAWGCKSTFGLTPEEKDRLRTDAKSKDLGMWSASLLTEMERHDLTGESGGIIRDMLLSDDEMIRSRVISGVGSASLSPELEQAFVELSRDPQYASQVISSVLSRQMNKGAATVLRLVEALGAPDQSTRRVAADGLRFIGSPEMKGVVASEAIALVATTHDLSVQDQAWKLVQENAAAGQVEALKSLAAKPDLPAGKKEWLQQRITAMEGK